MDLENNENLPSDITQFLDQFEKENTEIERAFASGKLNFYAETQPSAAPPAPPAQKDESFKKLEEKISELEEKFEASLRDRQELMTELAKSRAEKEESKSKDEFFENISATIANLKDSVDRLNRAQSAPARPMFAAPPPAEIYQQGYYYGAPIDQASKVGQEELFRARQEAMQFSQALYGSKQEIASKNAEIERKDDIIKKQSGEIDTQSQLLSTQKQEIYQHKADKEEKERFIAGLKEKTSRLKAVNSALEKEFKRVQDEKIEALRKSAEQAKEILSLKEQLSKAEERFKSFDFEGRILSIKNHYQQKVTKLETQLQEMSALCMKQVEEIENLKLENTRLTALSSERAVLQIQLEEKTAEIRALKEEVDNLTKHTESVMLQVKAAASQNNAEIEERIRTIEAAAEMKIARAGAEFESKLSAVKALGRAEAQTEIDKIRAEAEVKLQQERASSQLQINRTREDFEARLAAAKQDGRAEAQAEIEKLQAEYEANIERERSALEQKISEHNSAAQTRLQEELSKQRDFAQLELQQERSAAEAKLQQERAAAEAKVQGILNSFKNKESDIATYASEKIKQLTTRANNQISALNARMLELQRERDEIAKKMTDALVDKEAASEIEKTKTEESFKSLKQKINENDSVIEELKKKIEVLDAENKSLKTEGSKNEKEVSAQPPAPLAQNTELNYPDPALRRAKTRAKAAVLEDGEKKDFLEDTQTFFGRLKWSMLKED